jgi:hypothetical protein
MTNKHCPICGTLCTINVFDAKSGLKEWECSPYKSRGIVKRVPHYTFMTENDVIIHRIIEIDVYKIVIKEHPIPQTTVMKHSREQSYPYHQIVYEVDGAMDLTDFDKEKCLKKLKTYTVFA